MTPFSWIKTYTFLNETLPITYTYLIKFLITFMEKPFTKWTPRNRYFKALNSCFEL